MPWLASFMGRIGSGRDVFTFGEGSGQDIVRDFSFGDALRFEGSTFSLEDLSIAQDGRDTVITFSDNSVSVRLTNTDSSDVKGYSLSDEDDGGVVVSSDSFS